MRSELKWLWVYTCYSYYKYQFRKVQLLSCVPLFVTPWTAARQDSLSTTNSQSLLKLMCITSVMPSNHLILLCPLLLLPASGFFPVSQFFISGGQSIGILASTSVLKMNIQDWFPSGWTRWVFFLSKEFSRVFSNTTVQKYQLFGAQVSKLSFYKAFSF